MELLAMIGAWWGPRGVWWALACGSASGLCIGALYLLISGKSRDTAIPFGPFLVGGALVYGLLLAQPISHVRDHALFIAYAPAENPTIVVAVMVENGGHGGSTAAPIARAVLDYYLTGKRPGSLKPEGSDAAD